MKQLDPVALRLFRSHAVIPAERLEKIIDEIGPGLGRGPRRALLVGSIVMGALACVLVAKVMFAWADGSRSLLAELYEVSPVFLGVTGGAVTGWVLAKRARAARVGSVLLNHLRCPHCGYDLRLLTADPMDGVTVCPECGCGWRLGPKTE